MAKFCPKCGCKNVDEASFCSQCGAELPSKEEILKRSQNNENSNLNENSNGTVGINPNSTEEDDVEIINPVNTRTTESPKRNVIIDQNGPSSNQSKANANGKVHVGGQSSSDSSTTAKDDNKETIICCLVFAVLFLIALMCRF